MLLTTEQHARLADFYAREAENQKHPPDLRERLELKAELFAILVSIARGRYLAAQNAAQIYRGFPPRPSQ